MRRSLRHAPLHLPGPADGLSIGLMGGSFDPPHPGHAHVINVAMRRLGVDWIWVIPTAGNPFKRTATPFVDRLMAAQNRLAGPRVRISGLEARLGSRYTVDLVRALKRRAPTARFVLILGDDNLESFTKWRRWRELARMVPIAVISRPGGSPRAGLSRFARMFPRVEETAARRLPTKRPPAWVYLHARHNPTSSTELRALMIQAMTLPPVM